MLQNTSDVAQKTAMHLDAQGIFSQKVVALEATQEIYPNFCDARMADHIKHGTRHVWRGSDSRSLSSSSRRCL